MSHLEKLPTELLVEIFFYSMNLDLPRASPVIGRKLTSEIVFTRVVIEVFGPTWDQRCGNYQASCGKVIPFGEDSPVGASSRENVENDDDVEDVGDGKQQVCECPSDIITESEF